MTADVDVPRTWQPALQFHFYRLTGPASPIPRGAFQVPTFGRRIKWIDPGAREYWGGIVGDPRFAPQGPPVVVDRYPVPELPRRPIVRLPTPFPNVPPPSQWPTYPAGGTAPGDTRFCTNCGHEYAPGQRFCGSCGAQL